MIEKVISGGQNGVDIAGLRVAQLFDIPTGGWLPKGCQTLDGPKPEYLEQYGMKEHSSSNYKERTWKNIADADLTIRIAEDFTSPGERCTINGIIYHAKPHFDIDTKWSKDKIVEKLKLIAEYIKLVKIKTINVAGNSEKTIPGIHKKACEILIDLFIIIFPEKFSPTVSFSVTDGGFIIINDSEIKIMG